MRAKERRMVGQWIEANRGRILEGVQGSIRIPSVLDPSSSAVGAPFGIGCANALDHALGICAEVGMRTTNFGGYAGHAVFGPDSGKGYVGVLGHLDVVPPGDGWTRDPWGGAIDAGWIWGRGTSDDKGPTFAAVYAAIALLEVGIEVKVPVRLIFGCDEESEWRCMDHYFGDSAQTKPTLGFTPDAGFPLYHAEKGAITVRVSRKCDFPGIISIQSGLRANMVPDRATIEFDRGILRKGNARSGSMISIAEDGSRVDVIGKSAHGASPSRGVNAAMGACRHLYRVYGYDSLLPVIALGALDASGCGLSGSDELSGPTTANLGILRCANGVAEATLNVRYPATWSGDETVARMSAFLGEAGWKIEEAHHTIPLYVPIDAEPVESLMRVYRRHTGRRGKPKTTGGRTYATSIAPGGVAFGAAMHGDPDVAHRPDERFSVDRLYQCVAIYADAIQTLATAVETITR